jgi:electron transport complex protein RnfB
MSSPSALADQIDSLLPQTQCTKCGFNGCRPYAEAIAAQCAEINQCPPGGHTGIEALAQLLGRLPLPLNPVNGAETPLRTAVIDEALCIGCTLCIPACPVDAIIGAARRMHTVITSACTGCDLCVAPCPMDCIHMEAVEPARAWTAQDVAQGRTRHTAHKLRLASSAGNNHPVSMPQTSRDEEIAAALERARLRRSRAVES